MTRIALALLLMTTSAGADDEGWKYDFRKCWVTNNIRAEHYKPGVPLEGVLEEGSVTLDIDGNTARIAIDSGEIGNLEKIVTLLKICDKFWTCVRNRDEGKVKHCYVPKDLEKAVKNKAYKSFFRD
jgi:hypothetical protein